MNELRPNKSELAFLTLAYQRFYDLFEEVMNDDFWEKNPWYRFSRINNGFAVYSEILGYEPMAWVIDQLKKTRPPMEAEIGSELFKFVRNVLAHFPFFESWDDVWINKQLVNWHKGGQSIDRFLSKYVGKEPVKSRFWEPEQQKRMTYLSVNFPASYNEKTKVYLRDILSEKEGVKFSFILMKKIIDTQIEPSDKDGFRA